MDAAKLLEKANAHLRAGKLKDAEEVLAKVVRYQPTNLEALRVLIELMNKTGRSDEAVPLLQKAVATAPTDSVLQQMYAGALLRTDPATAEAAARDALNHVSPRAPILCLLGDIQMVRQNHLDAVETYRLAVEQSGDQSFPRVRLAQALHRAGKSDEAIATLREAIAKDPQSPEPRHALGLTLQSVEEFEEAEAAFRESIRLRPQYVPGHGSLGSLLQAMGRYSEAEESLRTAIRHQPANALSYLTLGNILRSAGRSADAENEYKRALEINPGFAEALVALSGVQGNTGRLLESLASARRAVEIAPQSFHAHHALGTALHAVGSIEQAVEAFRKSWRIGKLPSTGSNLAHALNYHPTVTPKEVFDMHREWAERHADSVPAAFVHTNNFDPQRRLRIGYVSPDFRRHAVSFFVEALLRGHDRSRVEVYCYSAAAEPDAVTERLRGLCDHWRDIARLGDERASQMIHADEIDILVDLAGHTAGNRLPLFARRAAPVQVTYQGYPNTTGLSAIDYRLTDPYADPPGQTEQFHSEKLIHLPRTAWCYTPPSDAPPVSELPALRNGYITFGSFNRLSKLSETTAKLWSDAVRAVPDARFVFKTTGLDEPATRDHVLSMFRRAGLEGDRLVLLGSDKSIPEHLEQYSRIDVALDSYPYHGTTTSCEALWMGVPSITLVGPVHVSRVGLSLLTNLGLPEFAVQNVDEFSKAAADLTGNVDRLATLRRTMRERMTTSPLMDVAGFCREVEDAYRRMWLEYCSNAGGNHG